MNTIQNFKARWNTASLLVKLKFLIGMGAIVFGVVFFGGSLIQQVYWANADTSPKVTYGVNSLNAETCATVKCSDATMAAIANSKLQK